MLFGYTFVGPVTIPDHDVKRKALYLVIFGVVAASAGTGSWLVRRKPARSAPPSQQQAPNPAANVSTMSTDLSVMLDAYRKIIVVTHDEATLSSQERPQVNKIGQQLSTKNRNASPKSTPPLPR